MLFNVHIHRNRLLNSPDIISGDIPSGNERKAFCIYSIRAFLEDSMSDIALYEETERCGFSIGLHPYDIELWDCAGFSELIGSISMNGKFMAIGECGLDFRFQDRARKQIRAFRQQLDIAKQIKRPVILHTVKSLPQTIKVLRESGYGGPTVFHGFRGTIRQAEEIASIGGFVSLSPSLSADTATILRDLRNFVLLETDECLTTIDEHYSLVSKVAGMEASELEETVMKNARRAGFCI